MEISMQAWSHQQPGEEAAEEPAAMLAEPDPDDSGPYERIAGDSSEEEEEEKSTPAASSQQRQFGQLGRMLGTLEIKI
jgi:hypothetical protein